MTADLSTSLDQCSALPCMQQSSFNKGGVERVKDGRDGFIKGGYNGWVIDGSAPSGYPPTALEVSPLVREYSSFSGQADGAEVHT